VNLKFAYKSSVRRAHDLPWFVRTAHATPLMDETTATKTIN